MFNKKEKQQILNLAKCLIENQKDTNSQLKNLNEKLDGGIGKLTIDGNNSIWSTVSNIDTTLSKIETNVYNKEQTVDVINKEYTYRKDYERVYNEDSDLLNFIETYCKYDDKYEVIELFDKIKCKYKVTSKYNIS